MANSPWNYISCEIVEQILLNVPTTDMVSNRPWVCKQWTNIILQPCFWIRKLKKIRVTINEDIKSALTVFEVKVQVACLYQACLNEEEALFNKKYKCPLRNHWILSITDEFSKMLKVAGCLVTRSVKRVWLHLKKKNIPVLPILMKLLAARESEVSIWDFYSFWERYPRDLEMLKGPNGVANIGILVACVSTLEGLVQNGGFRGSPTERKKISIAVDEDKFAIDPGFSKAGSDISAIYIKAGADISKISRSTSTRFSIIVSELESTHIIWITDVLKTLAPSRGFVNLVFPSYRLNKKESEELLKSLAESRVNISAIMCRPSIFDRDDEQALNNLAIQLGITPPGVMAWFVYYQTNKDLSALEIFISSAIYSYSHYNFIFF